MTAQLKVKSGITLVACTQFCKVFSTILIYRNAGAGCRISCWCPEFSTQDSDGEGWLREIGKHCQDGIGDSQLTSGWYWGIPIDTKLTRSANPLQLPTIDADWKPGSLSARTIWIKCEIFHFNLNWMSAWSCGWYPRHPLHLGFGLLFEFASRWIWIDICGHLPTSRGLSKLCATNALPTI